MNPLINRALPMIAYQFAKALKNSVSRSSGLEPFGVIKAKEAIRVPVVDQTLGYRLANPGARHIAAENRIDQGGFPHSGLAENCEVEGTQGRECLG